MTEHVDIIQAITGRITPSITLQVTEDCCLNCTYCYQINKKPNYMTKETAEAIINFLFEQHENPHVCSPVKKDTPGVILDFIGGEPLMNIEVINHVVEYFFQSVRRGVIMIGFSIVVFLWLLTACYTLSQKCKTL